MFGVRHLGMKLQSVDRLRPVFDGGERTGRRPHQLHELPRGVVNLIAVTHPNRHRGWKPFDQRVGPRHLATGPTEFTLRSRLNAAAERLTGELHSVADAKNRQPQFKQTGIDFGSLRVVNARGATRQNQSLRIEFSNPIERQIVPNELAKDVLVTHPPSDELRRLATEIEYQNEFFPTRLCGERGKS